MIYFKDITADNWKECINLELFSDEKEFIHPNMYSIAEAQFYPKAISKAIYDDDQMIGYAMFGEDEDNANLFYIDRLMISKGYRNKGYAFSALKLIVREAMNRSFSLLATSTHPENRKMQNLLTKIGFYTKNEIDNGELVYYYQAK